MISSGNRPVECNTVQPNATPAGQMVGADRGSGLVGVVLEEALEQRVEPPAVDHLRLRQDLGLRLRGTEKGTRWQAARRKHLARKGQHI